MSKEDRKTESGTIKRIGIVGLILSIFIMLTLLILVINYQALLPAGVVIIWSGIFFLAFVGFIISMLCICLGTDTERYIASKKILEYFDL